MSSALLDTVIVRYNISATQWVAWIKDDPHVT
jgi:hypothetical protein